VGRPEWIGPKQLRLAWVAVLLFGALVAAGAAAIGKVPGAPAWAAAGAAALAALLGALVPTLAAALKERRRREEVRRQEIARITSHLTAMEERYRDHMSAGGFRSASGERDEPVFLGRLVQERHADPIRDSDPVPRREPAVGSLAGFVDRYGGRLLLLGEGGSGKTTSLLQLGADAASRAQHESLAPIPVYVELKNFDVSESGFKRLFEMAANSILGFDEDEFKSIWRLGSKRFLFLFDGLDEQRGNPAVCVSALNEFTGRSPHAYVVTSRPIAAAEGLVSDFRSFDMLPLEDDQVETFLTENGLDRLYLEMSQSLRSLSRNPFMLLAVAYSYSVQPQSALPRNIGQLYQTFIDRYIFADREVKRELSRYSYPEVKKPILASLANRMTAAGSLVVDLDRIIEDNIETTLEEMWRAGKRRKIMPEDWGPIDFLNEIVANGIVRRVDSRLEFMHPSVQAYFTAVALAEREVDYVASQVPRFLWRHAEIDPNISSVEEPYEQSVLKLPAVEHSYKLPLLMLSGLLPDSGQLVKAISSRDPLLAARCVANANDDDSAALAGLTKDWLNLLDRAHERYRRVGARCLGAAGARDHDAVRRLVALAMEDADADVRAAATDAVVQLGLGEFDEYVAERIRAPLRHDPATHLLSRAAPRYAVRTLLEHWRRAETSESKRDIEEALAGIERTLVINELEKVAQSPGNDADAGFAEARRDVLDELASREAHVLPAPYPDEIPELSREWGERAAAKLQGASDAALVESLQHANAYVRAAVATQLADHENREALPALIDALSKESLGTPSAHEITLAAYRLGGDRVVTEFLSRVWGPDRALLFALPGPRPLDLDASTLPKSLGTALAAAGIRPIGPFVRRAGPWEIPPDVDVEETGGYLNVYRTGVQRQFLHAAAQVGEFDRLFPEVLRALEHENPAVRSTAVTLLGESNQPRAVEPLRALLARDEDRLVVNAAYGALAVNGSPDALDVLLDVLARGGPDETALMVALSYLQESDDWERLLLRRAQREHGTARSRVMHELVFVRRLRALTGRPVANDDPDERSFLIAAALEEAYAKHRRAAAAALRWSASDPGTARFIEELHATDPTRRARAAAALGELQEDEAAKPHLEAALADQDPAVRLAAARSLVNLRVDDALERARAVLEDVSPADHTA
jgi:HEAT repeat protein